jgi:hypothetical protein
LCQDRRVRRVSIDERRARLARRHRLGPHRASGVDEAARAMVCLHATDPATIFLSAHARVEGMGVAELERALYVDRTLVKHLAMRRTLFVFPRDVLGVAQAAASARVALDERRRLIRAVETSGLHRNGARWLAKASAQVVEVLADGRTRTFPELREVAPMLDGTIVHAGDTKWGGPVPVGPRVLTVLSAEGEIVRSVNAGGWTISKPGWASMRAWLGEPLAPPPEREALAALVRLWLRAFGPGTEKDVAWWLGSTLTRVRHALTDVGAVAVDLDGRIGYLLPDDLDDAPASGSWVALLPGLDPTPMGWVERDWYLGAHKAQVFDRSGNVGPTVWCDGRIVGGWRQEPDGAVNVQLLETVGRKQRRAIDDEAARLTAWLAGRCIRPRFPSPLCRG